MSSKKKGVIKGESISDQAFRKMRLRWLETKMGYHRSLIRGGDVALREIDHLCSYESEMTQMLEEGKIKPTWLPDNTLILGDLSMLFWDPEHWTWFKEIMRKREFLKNEDFDDTHRVELMMCLVGSNTLREVTEIRQKLDKGDQTKWNFWRWVQAARGCTPVPLNYADTVKVHQAKEHLGHIVIELLRDNPTKLSQAVIEAGEMIAKGKFSQKKIAEDGKWSLMQSIWWEFRELRKETGLIPTQQALHDRFPDRNSPLPQDRRFKECLKKLGLGWLPKM